MTLFDSGMRLRLESLINIADMEIRQDFHNGYIVDENDYTSNLTSHIRRIVNAAMPLRVHTHSQKLPSSRERFWGADAMVVLIDRDTRLGKICFFEAKTDRANWDYTHKPSLMSHFSSQLDRQTRAINSNYAVWEQFYTAESIHKPLNVNRYQRGSSCIIHDLAYRLYHPMPNTKVWTNSDIDLLCIKQMQLNIPITMGGIIRIICECHYGSPYPIEEIINFFDEKIDINEILIIEGSAYHGNEFEEGFADIILKKLKHNSHD